MDGKEGVDLAVVGSGGAAMAEVGSSFSVWPPKLKPDWPKP